MKPKIKSIIISVGILLTVGYFILAIWQFTKSNGNKICNRFEIELTETKDFQLINEDEISKLLFDKNLHPFDKKLRKVNTESIEALLRKNPVIKSAECYKTPSGIVHVTVHQRTPKFRVVGHESYYIDNERNWMPVTPNFSAYVPVVSGRVSKSMASKELFDFVTFLEDNPFWNAQIEQIFITDDLKIEIVPRVGDAIIVLGTLENFPSKLEKLRKLYTKGFNVFGWNRYNRIDLQYKDQVICTKIGVELKPPKVIKEVQQDSIIGDKT